MADTPSTAKRILIVGGGTAGWMTAAMLVHGWAKHGFEVTLLESDSIGIIGVGEGSTPKMRRFFDRIGVTEADWMPHCNATYKCGIRFPDWSTKPGYQSYYHPFFSQSDDGPIRAFYQNASLRSRNLDVHAHPDAFFISQYLAGQRRAPQPDERSGYVADYAYHFDAALIGDAGDGTEQGSWIGALKRYGSRFRSSPNPSPRLRGCRPPRRRRACDRSARASGGGPVPARG